jgi:hypothetical protein
MIGNWEEEKDKGTCDLGSSLLLQVLIFCIIAMLSVL